jgi:hypothetical protein
MPQSAGHGSPSPPVWTLMMMFELQSFPKFIPSEIRKAFCASVYTVNVKRRLFLSATVLFFLNFSITLVPHFNMADNSTEDAISYEDLALIEEQFEEVDVEIRMHTQARGSPNKQ